MVKYTYLLKTSKHKLRAGVSVTSRNQFRRYVDSTWKRHRKKFAENWKLNRHQVMYVQSFYLFIYLFIYFFCKYRNQALLFYIKIATDVAGWSE